MNSARTKKLVSRYESGLLSTVEVANSLLYDLVSEPEIDTDFLMTINSMPEAIVQQFHSLLSQIKEDDYSWTPFLITSAKFSNDPTTHSEKLRQIYALIPREGKRGQEPF